VTGGSESGIGGLAGLMNSDTNGTAAITNSYAAGAVTTGSSISTAGGLVGTVTITNKTNATADIINSYAAGAVTGGNGETTFVGGLVGANRGGTITNVYFNANAKQTHNGAVRDSKSLMLSGTDSKPTTDTDSFATATAAFANKLNANKGTTNPTWISWSYISGKNNGFPVLKNVGDGITDTAPTSNSSGSSSPATSNSSSNASSKTSSTNANPKTSSTNNTPVIPLVIVGTASICAVVLTLNRRKLSEKH
jgi:hypothetical protein